MIEPPPNGSIIEYPYLWSDQDRRGETEGRKHRPVCVALTVRSSQSEHHVLLLAVSGQAPRPDQAALAIPEIERRRAGLTRYPAAWITTSEYNYDILERSFYYDPNAAVLGALSQSFMAKVATELRERLRRRSARVSRIE